MGEPIPKICENCNAHPDDQVHCPQPCAAFMELEITRNQVKKLIEEVDEISADPTAYQVLISTMNHKEKLEEILQTQEVAD